MPKPRLVRGLRNPIPEAISAHWQTCLMTTEEAILDSFKHRGCGIRAASYPVGPQSWLPEACVWLQTEKGSHRLWVRSFAHCFDAEKLTFANKRDADSWALGAAQAIIDRALEQLSSAVVMVASEPSNSIGTARRLARRSMEALRRFKSFRSPQ
jgi:hypothetical protein